jgi:putative protein-disulfide isomerase
MEAREKQSQPTNNEMTLIKADGWDITFYTDPLCCWSWAMRLDWDRFIQLLPGAAIRYRMAGLIPSWQHFADHTNAVTKPIQMGPEWMHARALTGAPIDEKIWVTDPPASSLPACIAVKAAGLQNVQAAKHYFDATQRAVLSKRRNVARTGVLLQLADELALEDRSFDRARFSEDLLGPDARQAFRQDMMDWKYLQIGRLPAIIIRNTTGRQIVLTGYQQLQTLFHAAGRLNDPWSNETPARWLNSHGK